MMPHQNKYVTSIINYVNTVNINPEEVEKLEELSNGLIFSTILKQAKSFRFEFGELSEKVQVWGERLKNLRTIIRKIQNYFQNKIGKGIKTKDLNLISIAYNQNTSDIIKFFEVVLAVMIQAPNKQEHIEKIMSMDEQSQSAFVKMIQRIMEERILDINERKQQKIQYILEELQAENSLLREEISHLQLQKDNDSRELEELKLQVKKSQSDFESFYKSAEIDSSQWSTSAIVQNQNLKSMIQVLKKRLSTVVNEHEAQIFRYREQIHSLQMKVVKMSEVQEILQIYKEKYNETLLHAKSSQNWQKQKTKLLRIIEQKEVNIKKLQQKLDQLAEQTYCFQERQIYLQMEVQKREARFKQLQKQVKKRVKNNQQSSTFSFTPQTIASNISQPLLQLQELEQEVHKLKIKEKEALKDKNQLRRTTERHKMLTSDKKKLQRIILEISKEKRQQLHFVLTIVHDLSLENKKIRKLLVQNHIEFDV